MVENVDSDFLDRVMEKKKGFGYKWRMGMSGCVKNVNYLILIIGFPNSSI